MSDTFDPFTATLEQALAMPDADGLHGARYQWYGAQSLMRNRADYEKSPLDGMAVCCEHGLIAPRWLAAAFLKRYDDGRSYKFRSWDEAFGPLLPPGKHLKNARQRIIDSMFVALTIPDLLQKNQIRQ